MKLFFVVFFGVFLGVLGAEKIVLDDRQRDFLAQQGQILLGIDKSLKPFVIVHADGSIGGFEADLIDRINALSGANIALFPAHPDRIDEMLAQGKLHGIASHIQTSADEGRFDYTAPYLQMRKLVLAPRSEALAQPTPVDLAGKTVAIYRASHFDRKLASELDGVSIREYDRIEDVIMSIITRQSDVMFSNGSVFYIRNELGLPELSPVMRLKASAQHRYAVHADHLELREILDRAIEAIGHEELLALSAKWFWNNPTARMDPSKRRIILTLEQEQYLNTHPKVRICVVEQSGRAYQRYQQVNREILREIERLLIGRFEILSVASQSEALERLQRGECDVASAIVRTNESDKDVRFSHPYLEIPIVLATHQNQSPILKVEYLKNFKVAAPEGRGLKSNILNHYPMLNIHTTQTLEEAFKLLQSGQVDGVVGALGVLTEYIKHNPGQKLRINGTFEESLELSFAVQNDNAILQSILNVAIDTIPEAQKHEIINRWFSVEYVKGIDYSLIWKIAVPLVIVLLFFLLRTYDLKRLNAQLNQRIQNELERSRQKDNLIYQQNKIRSTQELISAIAHQWRQPLSELAMSQNIILSRVQENRLDPSEIASEIRDQQGITLFMSKTIDTFQNFYNDDPDTRHEREFALHEAYRDMEFLIKETLELHSITIQEKMDRQIKTVGNKNALSQALLVIIQNSVHFLISRRIQNPQIALELFDNGRFIVFTIHDNAGGTPPDRIDRIFDFNYSYNDDQTRSTGIGLYIARMIIQEKFAGEITAINVGGGLKTTITLPRQNPHSESSG